MFLVGHATPDRLVEYGFDRCTIQATFQTAFDEFLAAPISDIADVPEDYQDFTIRQISRVHFGFLFNNQYIYLRTPCVGTNQAAVDDGRCTDAGLCVDYDQILLRPDWAALGQLAVALDVPKLLAPAIATNQLANSFNVSFVCYHGRDCEAEGVADTDGDGFRDDEDYCHNLFTGSNCDMDGDLLGDGFLMDDLLYPTPGHDDFPGPPRLGLHCTVAQTAATSEANALGIQLDEKRLRRFQQQFCGGCDNCYDRHAGLSQND